MSRSSKRIALNGWLVIDKHAGYSSTAIVNKVRWLLNAKKAGHAGTLDPDATGLLAVALGEATKTIPYLTNATKTYLFQINFGSATDTDDISGKKIKWSDARPTTVQLEETLKFFTGNIKQTPPKFSAIKINGKRAYDLSRKGVTEIKIKARDLMVEELDIIKRIDADSAIMKMVCGKGGYVRSMARDIGERLGCFAHASNIRRTSSGPLTLLNSISTDIILEENVPKIFKNILPIQTPLDKLQRFDCLISDVSAIRNGQKILLNEKALREDFYSYVCFDNKPIAIGKISDNYFYPKKVFSFGDNV